MSLGGKNSSISIVWGNRRTPTIMSLSHGIGLLGFLNYPSSLQNWKPNFFFVSRSGWEFVPSEDLDEAPKFFRSWGIPLSSASFSSFCCFSFLFMSDDGIWLVLLFAVSQRPHLKKRYQHCIEKVKEYLETIKDFDKLVSPQSLFLHFLGPKPSTKVWRNLEVVKKS